MEYYFYFKEQLADKLVIQMGIYQTFSQKWQNWACHFKGNNTQYFLPMLKSWAFKWNRILENLYPPVKDDTL